MQKIGKMKKPDPWKNLYERLGLEITSDNMLDLRDHLRELIVLKQGAPVDYERMSTYVEGKFKIRISQDYLIRLLN